MSEVKTCFKKADYDLSGFPRIAPELRPWTWMIVTLIANVA